MAVEHIVCMKIGEPLPDHRLEAIYRQCEQHFDKIPGVVTASIGGNFRSGQTEFTHALVIRFEDRQALENFMPHPGHRAAGELLARHFSEFLVIDYETDRD